MYIMCVYLYTEDTQMRQKKEKPIRKTLLLDQTTIDILEVMFFL